MSLTESWIFVSDIFMPRGRPPIGDKAMSGAERQRRYFDRIRGTGTDPSHPSLLEAEERIRKLEAECAKLKRELKRHLDEQRGGSQGQLKVRPRQEFEFGEVAKLRAEIGKLKNDIRKLKAMLQEEPAAAKLRKKVVDQQVELAAMRRTMKEIAKERDANK